MCRIIPFSVPEVELSYIFTFFRDMFKIRNGPKIKELEEKFAKYIGTKYAVTFASGRYSTYLLYKYYGCKQILVPSYTCIAAIDSARWANAKVIFADIDNKNYNPVFDEKMVKGTDCICLSFLYGLIGTQTKQYLNYAKKNKIKVIEDAAISTGATFKKKMAGSLGNAAMFSFQSSKILTGWRGGLITTNDKKLYDFLLEKREKLGNPPRLKLLFNCFFTYIRRLLSHPILYSITLYPLKKIFLSGPLKNMLGKIMEQNPKEAIDGWSEKSIPRGDKYKFTNMQAGMVLKSLKNIEKILKKRRNIAKKIISGLKSSNIITPPISDEHTYGRMPVRIKGLKKENLKEYFLKKGIEIEYYYPYICPNTRFYKDRFSEKDYPNAIVAAKETFLLPMSSHLSDKDIKIMIDAVIGLVK